MRVGFIIMYDQSSIVYGTPNNNLKKLNREGHLQVHVM